MRAVALLLSSLLALAGACSASGGSNPFNASADTGGAGTSSSGAATTGMGNGAGTGGAGLGIGGGMDAGGAGGGSGCTSTAELVYVLTSYNTIESFDPGKKLFAMVATLSCDPTNKTMPNSMAVDRDAVAWLNYVSADDSVGAVYTYDLKKNDGCQKTGIDLIPGWTRLGMGFSTDTMNGTSETLYVAGAGAGSLGAGKIDMSKNKIVWLGQFTGASNALQGLPAELTGTGDARLFGFFTFPNTLEPVHVAQVDKTNGATPAATDVTLMQVTSPMAWAFAFWGGDFYLFTAPGANANGNSTVVKYTPGAPPDTAYIPDVGFTIVGAGVSTCAPLKPPA